MLGQRLKQLRKEKGMTQAELAEALGVSTGTVAMWETNKRKPTFEMLERLSDIFDKQVGYIMGTSNDDSSAALREDEVNQLGEWAIEEEYEDFVRKLVMLDEYGQKNLKSILMNEFKRCQEQGTLLTGSYSISIKTRPQK